MQPLRVLIPVDHAVGISGPHRNVVGSLNALGARPDVDLVLLTGRIDPDEPYAKAPNIEIRLGYEPHDPRKVATNLRLLRSAARGCDVVYVPTNLKSLLYAQTIRAGRRLVAGPNVSHLPLPGRQDAPGRIELLLMSNAWFEPSRIRQQHVRRVSGVGSVQYIHHAIDLNKFSPDRRDPELWKRLGFQGDTVKVVFVGRDDEQSKGLAQLLEAIDIIGKLPDGEQLLEFALVGRMSEQTQQRVQSLENVHLLGFRQGTELASIYASADMSVMPSSWETFGFTVLESMACGTPVIASRTAAIPEVLDDVSGMLIDIVAPGSVFRPNAAATLADAISSLAGNPDLRQRLGTNARHRAETHFSESRLGDELLAILRGNHAISSNLSTEHLP